jgi:5-methylcytosine-specific restriction endonuclease McrA
VEETAGMARQNSSEEEDGPEQAATIAAMNLFEQFRFHGSDKWKDCGDDDEDRAKNGNQGYEDDGDFAAADALLARHKAAEMQRKEAKHVPSHLSKHVPSHVPSQSKARSHKRARPAPTSRLDTELAAIHKVQRVGKKERVAVTGYMRRTIAYEQGWKCGYCHDTLPPWYEVDHRMPLWSGGHPTNVRNLVAVCKRCHAAKTHKENDLRVRLLRRQRQLAQPKQLHPPLPNEAQKKLEATRVRLVIRELAGLGGGQAADCMCLRCGLLFSGDVVHCCTQ